MNRTFKIALSLLTLLIAGTLIYLFYWGGDVTVLNPKGWVGLEQKDLLVVSTLLMLIIVIPVFILTFVIAWKYRASNEKATYSPDWDYNFAIEAVWWSLPCFIIVFLGWITWTSSHQLDPFKPIERGNKTVLIQVVALDWKWLFIYPDEGVASVNFFQFPENTPVQFEITADAPMNSFWIPQLGGQIFAMPGMKTKLALIADVPGEFNGASANLSGEGFAGMSFVAKSTSEKEYLTWLQLAKQSPQKLGLKEYLLLAEKSKYNPVVTYVLEKPDLYDWIVMKYMMP